MLPFQQRVRSVPENLVELIALNKKLKWDDHCHLRQSVVNDHFPIREEAQILLNFKILHVVEKTEFHIAFNLVVHNYKTHINLTNLISFPDNFYKVFLKVNQIKSEQLSKILVYSF